MAHNITLIPGDGIGPEVCAAVVRILEASGGFEDADDCRTDFGPDAVARNECDIMRHKFKS